MRNKDFHKRVSRMQLFIKLFTSVVFIFIVILFSSVIYLTFKVSKEINENGLKGVVEQIWYGNKQEK